MSAELLQIINVVANLLFFIGLVACVYILVKNSGRSAKALEDIAKSLHRNTTKK